MNLSPEDASRQIISRLVFTLLVTNECRIGYASAHRIHPLAPLVLRHRGRYRGDRDFNFLPGSGRAEWNVKVQNAICANDGFNRYGCHFLFSTGNAFHSTYKMTYFRTAVVSGVTGSAMTRPWASASLQVLRRGRT